MPLDRSLLVPALKNIATRLRIDSIRSTSEAGSGHPTSCCSAADLVAALFFAEMRFDPKDPQHPGSDRFVLSKGHAAPLLYAAWAEAGAFDRAELLKLRELGLRPRRASHAAAAVCRRGDRVARPGHLRRGRQRAERAPHRVRLPHLLPPRRRRVGRGLGLGSGGRRRHRRARQSVRHHRRQRRSARAGRRCGSTTSTSSRAAGARSAGTPSSIDGHDMDAILDAYAEARATTGRPTMIVARTIKGKGVSFAEGKDGWHGKAFKKGEELDRALAELEAQFVPRAGRRRSRRADPEARVAAAPTRRRPSPIAPPAYKLGEQVATREAYGTALAKLGDGGRARRRARRRRQELDLQRQVREGRFRIASTRTSSPSR